MQDFIISVIICTKNRTKDLNACLESLYNQTLRPDEIIIVDCSDNADTNRMIRGQQLNSQIPLKYIHTLPGLTKQRNLGISMSQGDIISFLDDDVVLDQNYLSEILNCFTFSERVDAVGGLITNTYRDNLTVRLFKKVFMLPSFDSRKGRMKRSGFAAFPFTGNRTDIQSSQVLSGCCCNFRKSVFDEYQFDEYFDGYGLMEDVEFSYRVSRERNVLYTPHAKLIHKRSKIDRDKISKLYQMKILNHFHVFKKLVCGKRSDWFYFWWSHVGINIESILWSIRVMSLAPIFGSLSGYRVLIQRSLRNNLSGH
jgi:GT2 family glycosyltransferase